MHDATLGLEPPIRLTLGESVAESLREAIFRSRLRPDQRLSEAQIASSLKVSRAPVRDALAELEQEGLLTRPAGRGVVVRLLGHRDVEEICSLRLALESLAVRRVARAAAPEHLQRMTEAVDEAKKVKGPEALALADLRFHEALVRAADHDRLLAGWLNLRSQIRLLIVQRNRGDAGTLRGTARAHADLLKAIREGDKQRALKLLEAQLSDQYTWFLRTFPESSARRETARSQAE